MGSRELALVIRSAQGLRNVHNLQLARTLKPLAVVSIRDKNNNLFSSKEETPVDKEGETNPQWNHPVTFNIDITSVTDNQLALVFKIKSRRKIRAKDVGEVRVPIAGLEGFGDANAVAEQQMMENVVNVGGTSQQGKLYFSYKFGNTVQHPPASTANMRNSATSNGQRRHGTVKRLMGKVAGEVVTTVVGMAATAGISAAFAGTSGDDDDPGNDEEHDRRED